MPEKSPRFLQIFRPLGLSLSSLACTTLSLLFTSTPIIAADRLYFTYTPLKLSLRVESLELFAKEGKVNKDLGFYLDLGGVSAEDRATLREVLTKRAELKDPLYVPRFFNSPTGEALLEQLGKFIAIPWNNNGKYALRGAIIQAALDPAEGLTLLNVLRKYPTDIHINLEKLLEAAQLLNILGRGTNDLISEMESLSVQEAAKNPNIDYAALPDLRQPGPLEVAPEQVWQLTDTSRNRHFRVLVYQPQQWLPGKTPVIVFSHGLASRPEDFSDRAKQLASYGYLVVMPQHPGSDTQQLDKLLSGYSGEVFEESEFIDRPRDVSYVLDELERRNAAEFGGRLDLNAVGVFGHSFGGYTALMLAGAEIDFDSLASDCHRDVWSPNLALLLECRALELPRQTYRLRDERVKAIFVANPVTGTIFGARGLAPVKIPVLMAGGSSDPATPVAIEQLRAFVWLGSQDKYLALVKGQAHVNFTQLDASSKAILNSFKELKLPDQTLIDQYANAYLVAFAKYYLSKDDSYRPYFQPGYALYISREPNSLYLVNRSAVKPLTDFFNQRKPGDRPALIPNN
jgi:predicted dienelactone hydrolase